MKQNDQERRGYFRVEDKVFIDAFAISEEEYKNAPETLEKLHQSAFSLSADFATLNNKIHPVLNNIKQSSPEIAEYLEFLNTKVDGLSQLLMCNDKECNEDDAIYANVSASGIMFESNTAYTPGQALKLELVLLPEKIGIVVYGRVINCEPCEPKQVSVEFEHMRYEDQELMIKHNLNKQMADLREKNDNA